MNMSPRNLSTCNGFHPRVVVSYGIQRVVNKSRVIVKLCLIGQINPNHICFTCSFAPVAEFHDAVTRDACQVLAVSMCAFIISLDHPIWLVWRRFRYKHCLNIAAREPAWTHGVVLQQDSVSKSGLTVDFSHAMPISGVSRLLRCIAPSCRSCFHGTFLPSPWCSGRSVLDSSYRIGPLFGGETAII